MMDKTIPYHDVIMCRPADLPPERMPVLPAGYGARLYLPGDAQHWSRIETAAGEFDKESDARARFEKEFMPHEDALRERLVFVTDAQGMPVANATLWWADDVALGRVSLLHWVAAHPDAQGKGLGKAVCKAALSIEPTVGFGTDIWLTTQTWSWFAIGLYLSLGFRAHKSHLLAGHANQFEDAAKVMRAVMRPKDYMLFMDSAIS